MTPILGIIASQITGHLVTGSYESIATANGTGSSAVISFSSIPSTYKHLQIRYAAKYNNVGTGEGALTVAINSSNLTRSHYLLGDGSAASANTLTIGYLASIPQGSNAGYAGGIIDILDYNDTNKTKVARSLTGWDNNGSGLIILYSGFLNSTSAVTSLTLTGAYNFTTDTKFALYGIKGA